MDTLLAKLGEHLLRNEPLAKYTAARLGGPADYVYIARNSTDELFEVVGAAWKTGIPVRVIGGGANLLVADDGFRGLVVVNMVTEVQFGDWHDGRSVSATAGTSLHILAHKCAAQGLAGLEWAVSVPGTVGGAIINNAGAHGGDMAQAVCDVVVLEAARGVQLLTNADLQYGYRSSSLKARADRRFLVLLATLALPPGDPDTIRARMQENIAYRKRTQPPGASLGSIFKNPPGDYAGRLIEAAGLKGFSIGHAQVSPVHANFFINTGGATASDYYALVQQVQAAVLKHSGVLLHPEIEFLGEGFTP